MRNIIFFLLLVLFGTNPQVWAQSGSTTGAIFAVVKDPQDAVITGATVTIKQQETNFIRNVETNQDGTFQLIQLPPGNYELSVSANGYNLTKTQINLTIGSTLVTLIKLSIASVDSVVEVTADNPVTEVRIESSNINSSNRIENLPINRRDFLDFALTSPRVTPDRVPNQGVFSTSGLSFNGQSGRFNNITIDGLDNNDTNQGAVRATFSQEAVQEFQVVSDGYSAEFGRALAGVVNIVTKAGNNDFHSTLFFLNRNDEISARDVFDTSKTPYSQYQFGATLSGPIKRDKAFFFTSFERLSIKQNIIVTLSDQTVKAGRNQNYPLKNGAEPFSVGTTSFLARGDVRLSAQDSLWVRYNGSFTYNGAFEPFGGLTDRSSSGILDVRDNSLAFNNTYFSSTLGLVNETRFLYGRRKQSTLPVSRDAGVQLLTPEGTVSFGHNNFLPEFNNQRIYQIVNNVSLSRGINQIKFGVDFTYVDRPPQNNAGLLPDGLGVFSPLDFSSLFGMPGLPFFTGLEAFDPTLRSPQQRAFLGFVSASIPGFPSNINLADSAIPIIYLQGFGNKEMTFKEKLFSFFLQDDIRLRENLVVKAGVRYDINRLDFTPSNNGNFSPRLGISYRPKKLPKMSLHAAYGLFFSLPFARSTSSARASETGLKTLLVAFPLSVIPFSLPGHKFSSLNQLPAGVDFVPQLNIGTQYQPDLRSSYSQQATTGVDYLIGSDTTISLTYSYVRGLKLLSLREINPVVNPIANNPLQGMIIGRVDPTKGSLFEFETAFDSYYHGFTIALSRRLAKRLNFLAHYTFSKGIDNIADFSVVVTDRQNNPLDIASERGLSLQDVRNRFSLSSTWELSYTNNPLLRDFHLSTIVSVNSGRPYNLLAGVDLNLNGDGGLSDRPTGLGRNVGVTPGFATVDMRLSRTLNIKERYKIQGFVEAFNLFNRVNINPNLIDRTFSPNNQGGFNLPPQENGRYTVTANRFRGAFAPRQFQVGIRLSF
ncbi:MAG: ferrienterochelin and colicins outer membrane receptor [bacterium]|nr:MAG: ferrienterochelin and colicins outer membrane receptor [bacterium]